MPLKRMYQFKILMKDPSIDQREKVFEIFVISYDGNPDYFFPSIDLQRIKKGDQNPKLRVLEKIF